MMICVYVCVCYVRVYSNLYNDWLCGVGWVIGVWSFDLFFSFLSFLFDPIAR